VLGADLTDVVFNQAKGRLNYYASLPLGTDALELILLQSTGLVADATMIDYASVAAILAGASDEVSVSGYARLVVTSGITVATNNTSNQTTFTFANPSFPSLATGQIIGALIVAYRATSGAADSAKIPLTKHGIASIATNGSNFSGTISTFVGIGS
jgi:hypothetical protein